MADLYISEYRKVAEDSLSFRIQNTPQEPSVTTQKIAISTVTSSSVFDNETTFIEIIADGACHIEIGLSPTATTSSMKIPADRAFSFGVEAGHALSVVQP